ncbi:MAG: chaperonin GroEL [Chloroflexota bacterium]|nr:chaperonin GroEL [Chloroflexota bacterium]
MPKQLRFADEARGDLKAGMEVLAKAVGTTLGPKGRNVAMEQQNARWMTPKVSHDGATVAKWIELPDRCQNMGTQLVKTAAMRTNEVAGDGTTTATVLAQAIVQGAMKNIAAGSNPMLLKRGIEKAAQAVLESIREQAVKVGSKEEVEHAATIAGHDPEIGKLIAEVVGRVGKDGVVTIEDSPTLGFEVRYLNGMPLDRRGFLSRHFITDPTTREAVVETPYILMTDEKIQDPQDLVPTLERISEIGERNLVVIADDVEGKALTMLVANKARGTFKCLAIKAPGLGTRRREMLDDLALFTGGTVISQKVGKRLDRVTLQDLGRADKVVSDEESTVIIEGHGSQEDIQARVDQLKREIEHTYVEYESQYDREWLRKRVGGLTSGVAVVRVGAATETELEEKKLRVEDAVSATQAALEEGIVPGGGVILLNVIPALDEVTSDIPDERVGIDIMRRALEAPMRQLAENAGYSGSVVVEEVRRRQVEAGVRRIGFDILTGEYGDMVDRGIIDPAKVTRCAVENGVGVATMILSTEALVVEMPRPPRTEASPTTSSPS